MGACTSFKDLIVWQKSHELVLDIYKITRNFSDEEKFGLTSQMRRSAVSIPANIAEGFKRKSKKDKTNFYNIAQALLEELKYYIILSRDLGYIHNNDDLLSKSDEVGKLLYKFIGAIEK